MKRRTFAFAVALTSLASSLAAQNLKVGVDPRVELLSIVFRLAGNREYTQGSVKAYNEAIDKHFGPHRKHPAVQLAAELRDAQGVSYDAVMSMAANITDVDKLAERVPFDSPTSTLEKRWRGAAARPFLAALRQFVRDTDFAAFQKSQQPLYEETTRRARAFVDASLDLTWFDKFFGARPNSVFILAPGLANGGGSYGASVTLAPEPDEIWAIPGVWRTDSSGTPEFPSGWRELLVHEFAHTYVNGLCEPYAKELEKSGNRMLEPVRDAMRAQAYVGWRTLMNESLVRASTARYVLDHSGPDAAARTVAYEHSRMFLWTGGLLTVMNEYAAQRDKYPALKDFMPRIVAFFDETAPKVPDMVRKFDETRPRVVSSSIANGATDVDPATTEITFKFDRKMRDRSWSVIRTDPATYPKTGSASYDETTTVFRLGVTLEPDHEYELSLNSPSGGAFVSADGIPAKQYRLKFRTGAAK